MMILSKKYKELLKTLIFIDCMYICYWVALGFMYILSMPYDEAIRLASYSRYMMSCIIIFFGIVGIMTFELNTEKNKIYNIVLATFILSAMYFNPLSSYKYFYSGNEHSEIDKIDKMIQDYPIGEFSNEKIYLYMDCSFTSYYHWLLRYKYFNANVNVKCSTLDTYTLEEGAIVIAPTIGSKLEENNTNLIKIYENVFKVKSEEREK